MVSDNLFVTIGSCCTRTVSLSCVTDNVVVEVFHIVGKIFLYKFLNTFTVSLQYFNLVMFEVCSNYLALAICRFCTSVSVGHAMSQCLRPGVPPLSFIYVNLTMVLST